MNASCERDWVDNKYHPAEWICEQLSLDKSTVYRLLNNGTIPAVQIGKRWFVSELGFFAFLDAEEERQTHARRTATTNGCEL